jgi:hypothetical protein
VVVASMPRGPDAAPEVNAVAQGGRRRARAAGVAQAGEHRVGCGRRWRLQRGDGEDEQGRHEEEAKAPAPRRLHGCGRARAIDRVSPACFLEPTEQGRGEEARGARDWEFGRGIAVAD